MTLTTPGDATLNGAVFGSKSVTIDPANIFINANLTSGGTLDLTATDAIDIANAVTVRSDSTGAGSGDMTLDATTIKADPTSLIVAGASAGPPTSKVSVYADGGDLTLGTEGHERFPDPTGGPQGCAQRAPGRQCNAGRRGLGDQWRNGARRDLGDGWPREQRPDRRHSGRFETSPAAAAGEPDRLANLHGAPGGDGALGSRLWRRRGLHVEGAGVECRPYLGPCRGP